MMGGIREQLDRIRNRHMEFIESNYHIFDRRLILERRKLMLEGSVFTQPWIESTPRYVKSRDFESLDIPTEIKLLLKDIQKSVLPYRPYQHQCMALEAFFKYDKNLIVSTGTGSGKTETFLYIMLGLLAEEAKRNKTLDKRALRTIILYPMNALVSDQLSRIRRVLGVEEGAKILEKLFKRRVQFGMYTSRTPYHGKYDTGKNKRRIKPVIDFLVDLKYKNKELYDELDKKGRIPSKDLELYREGRRGEDRFKTHKNDSELFSRQEMTDPNEYGGTPDILITNYSMLEYMLLRPIEHALFESTKAWLNEDFQNKLTIVIDEAHLYRGAQGAEVAMLLRRLLHHLQIEKSRVKFILSSASLGKREDSTEATKSFGAALTGEEPNDFEIISGKQVSFTKGSGKESFEVESGLLELRKKLKEIPLKPTLDEFGISVTDNLKLDSLEDVFAKEYSELNNLKSLYDLVTVKPYRLDDLSNRIFTGIVPNISEEATLIILSIASQISINRLGERLLPTRAHIFLKGLPKIYVCINPNCEYRRENSDGLLGRMYTEPRFQCDCGARVFELYTDRNCGAAYIKAYWRTTDLEHDAIFLWDEIQDRKVTSQYAGDFEEVHVLVEAPRSDENSGSGKKIPAKYQTPFPSYLDIRTGYLLTSIPEKDLGNYLEVRVPIAPLKPTDEFQYNLWSWLRCPACGITSKRRKNGGTSIMDLETKGEEPFANITKELFQIQKADKNKKNFPNEGKKVLCFSDGRQKAARLARDLQRTIERDSFREMIVEAMKIIGNRSLLHLFPAFAYLAAEYRIGFFDDEDASDTYEGSRSAFENAKSSFEELSETYMLDSKDLIFDYDVIEDMNKDRPSQFNSSLLRLLGNRFYSIRAALIAYLVPTDTVRKNILSINNVHDPSLLEEILVESLNRAAKRDAFDPTIPISDVINARASFSSDGWMDFENEGLSIDELVPDDLISKSGISLTSDELRSLRASLIRGSEDRSAPRLFISKGRAKFVINPDAVTLKIAINDSWKRCVGCKQFTPLGIASKCPECSGDLEEVGANDMHLLARKSLLRDPCEEVYLGKRRPFTIRSEEHSAQLSNKDFSDAFSRTERYELLFQDIILEQNQVEQPVDILSCTTTMEVGIDIGSLTGIGLRTIPPLPSNYQQRAGRAGRRGASLSTIVTFANNSPHETYNFNKPENLIGAEIRDPIIYVGNQRICQRHVNATLIQSFFQKAPIEPTADVFSSLGSSYSFFSGSGTYSLNEFEKWLNENVLDPTAGISNQIGDLLPDSLAHLNGNLRWRLDFVEESAKHLLASLRELSLRGNWSRDSNEKDNLLSVLLDESLLPTFSFPTDVCSFTVLGQDRESRKTVAKYDMAEDMRQALSEYIPGRQIVVDKKTFTSYGLYFAYPGDLSNRASKVMWDNLDWLNYCGSCETVIENREINLSLQGELCPIPGCRQPIKSIPVYRPEGFSPRVTGINAEEGQEIEGSRVYATSAKFPLQVEHEISKREQSIKVLEKGVAYHSENQSLEVVNFGPNGEGFEVCTRCGAVGSASGLNNPHDRPYPKDLRAGRMSNKCTGDTVKTSFGYFFKSDLTVIRMKIEKPLMIAYGESWFNDACRSLSEALVIGATRVLDIDSNEISGGYRPLPPLAKDDEELVDGYVEFFLYDTTSGGAGFASSVLNRLHLVISETRRLLENCTCSQSCHSCLRSYTNRIWHEKLDRQLALALLNYLDKNELPVTDYRRISAVFERLSLALNMIDKNVTSVPKRRDGEKGLTLVVSLEGNELEVKLISCLTRLDPVPNSIIQYSDYEAYHNLPAMTGYVYQRLRGHKNV